MGDKLGNKVRDRVGDKRVWDNVGRGWEIKRETEHKTKWEAKWGTHGDTKRETKRATIETQVADNRQEREKKTDT